MKTHISIVDDPISPVNLLAAMANPKRLQVLCLLSEKELPVYVLAEQVGLTPSALSQHLSMLRELDLVESRRDAQRVFYYSRSPAVRQLLKALNDICGDDVMRRYRLNTRRR